LAGFAIVLGVHEKLSAWSEVMKGRDRLENVVVDGRVILICMHVLMAESVEFIDWNKLALNRIQRRFLANTVTSSFEVFH
jgi:hypothetical protein